MIVGPGTLTPRAGEVRPIISDLQGRNRIEYKTYKTLHDQVVDRYLTRLPYMKRWSDFKERKSTFVGAALQVFSELRASGRTLRPRVAALLEGTGLRVNDLLGAMASFRLVAVKRGRTGGIYYASK